MRILLSVLALLGASTVNAADLPEPEKLPIHKGLPDPLVMLDGTRVRTADDWAKKRRPELRTLVQHYMYGYLPAPAKVTAKVDREDKTALGGKATLREISLTVGGAAEKIHLLLVVPNDRAGPAPVFVGMNFRGNHTLLDDDSIRLPTAWIYPGPGVKNAKAAATGRGKNKEDWDIAQAVERGYAVATFYSGDADPDRAKERGGLRPTFDKDEKAGTIAFWAWAIHRAVDYLVTRPDLDAKKVIVFGHSRLGKTALLAAAMDDRIALAIPSQAGCGGTAPSRGTVGESVERINKVFPHWFNAAFKKFSAEPARLPFDQHSLLAIVAPRPVLFSNAVEDSWANPDGQFEVLKAAEPVYKLLGADGLASPKKPKVGTLSAGRLGYFIRDGKHSTTSEDWRAFLDFADRHLGKPAKKTKE